MRRDLILVLGFALGARWIVGCSTCAAPCAAPQAVVLRAVGYAISSVTSDCQASASGTDVYAAAQTKGACHIDATLDDGQHVTLTVSMDTERPYQGCCSNAPHAFVSSAAPVVVQAPPGYKPYADAGARD